MKITANERNLEEKYLKEVSEEVLKQIKNLEKEINFTSNEIKEFRKLMWEAKGSIDSVEMRTNLMNSELEAKFMLMKMEYYKKLFRCQNSPYFGRIDFKEKDQEGIKKVYIGITNVTKELEHYVYDWRSPIASLFYDYGIGKAKYEAPEGEIFGEMTLRRQYKIENNVLKRIFDSDLNVVDDCLQEVLSDNSGDKMRNIVNTIQKEQNEIIRNISSKVLVVQGIAGSGKTSVALHRIAFLLYKIKNLKSTNVLIFSPNNIFSEYISDVLPELGEDNAMSTTFQDFAQNYLKEFKRVETFSDFIERFYTGKEKNYDLVKFKLSSKMIGIIESYVKSLENNLKFIDNLFYGDIEISKEYLTFLIKERFCKLPLFCRIEKMSEHLCDKFGLSYGKNKKSFNKKIKDLSNIKMDFIKIYSDLFLSEEFSKFYGSNIVCKLNKKIINYEDALCFIYMKGLLNDFPYSNLIKQVVIDEAQDYNELQYIILSKIFRQASFTILGDVNQTINPYQKYDSLEVLKSIFNDGFKYVELTKTYRSSSEIIEYTNNILNLKFVSAIRKPNNVPVKFRNNAKNLVKDINYLKNKYSSVAIITKNKQESLNLYNYLKGKLKDISLIEDSEAKFNKNLVVVPSYLSKGLEFDAVISYAPLENGYDKNEKYLFYVVCTRCQHELIIYSALK